MAQTANAAIGGYVVAVFITNRWDLAKKRNEFDLQLTTDFYDAIGKFKPVGRQAEVLDPNAKGRVLDRAIELEGLMPYSRRSSWKTARILVWLKRSAQDAYTLPASCGS